MNDTSGQPSLMPFATFDQQTCSWKTSEGTSLSGSTKSSPTLPPSGSMRNGELWAAAKLVPLTGETASGSLLPTPVARDHKGRAHRRHQLPDAILGPPPDSNPNELEQRFRESKHWTAAQLWCETHGTIPPLTVISPRNNNPALNPELPEWMMGFPPGWVTDPELSIPRTRQLQCIGNAIQPQTCAAAFNALQERTTNGEA